MPMKYEKKCVTYYNIHTLYNIKTNKQINKQTNKQTNIDKLIHLYLYEVHVIPDLDRKCQKIYIHCRIATVVNVENEISDTCSSINIFYFSNIEQNGLDTS